MRYLMLVLVLLSAVVHAEIYKWVDEAGKVHFGDKPDEKAKVEKLDIEVTSYNFVTYETVSIPRKKVVQSNAREVTMYSTEWCGYCKMARNYFEKNGIPYTDYDIEKDNNAREAYASLGGRGVPVILVDDKRMNGFSAEGFERIYK